MPNQFADAFDHSSHSFIQANFLNFLLILQIIISLFYILQSLNSDSNFLIYIEKCNYSYHLSHSLNLILIEHSLHLFMTTQIKFFISITINFLITLFIPKNENDFSIIYFLNLQLYLTCLLFSHEVLESINFIQYISLTLHL
jgi:hypothetical protein